MSANTTADVSPNQSGEDWPTLVQMGVTRFDEVSHYTLRKDGKGDVLRVHYSRAKGSLLPVVRRYHFGRALRSSVADGGTARMEDTYEVSPILVAAIDELDALIELNKLGGVSDTAVTADVKNELLTELDALRKATMRALDAKDSGTLAVQFEQIAKRIETL